jgi:hypothetical protein
MEDKIKKIEQSIENLNNKKSRIYFFVQDTKGNAKASIKYIYEWSNGELWQGRLIGFSIGIVVFTVMSMILFGEGISTKTGICLLLSIIILAIQIFWK